MKLEKREITLNEYDSLLDIYHMERTLLMQYVQSIAKAKTKQTLGELLRLTNETGEDVYFIKDLLNGSAIQNGE